MIHNTPNPDADAASAADDSVARTQSHNTTALWPIPPAALSVILVVLTLIAYIPAYSAGFVWDDDLYLEKNSAIQSPDGLFRLWVNPRSLPQYYPLVYSTYWIEYQLWGLDPAGYHVTNVLLHLACAFLVWWLLARLRVPGAWLAAAIFAVHPVEVESVAWVTERKNVLSMALALLSLLALFRFAPPEDADDVDAETPDADRLAGGSWFSRPWIALGSALRERGWWYLLALSLFALALFAKTAVVTLPAVALAIDWWKSGRLRAWKVLATLPLFAIAIGMGLMTLWIETSDHVGASGPEFDHTPAARFIIAGRALWFYAGKIAWPHPVTLFYPRWQIETGAPLVWAWPISAIAVIVALWALRGRIGRGPLAAVLIFAGVLAPVLGFFNIYYSRYSFVADHFQYHASVALIALAAAAVATFLARQGAALRIAGALAVGGLLVLLSALTFQQAGVYHSLETLYQDAIRKNPLAWLAYGNLAAHLESLERTDEAIAIAREGIVQNPDRSELHDVLGVVLLLSGERSGYRPGQLEELVEHLRQATGLNRQNSDAQLHLAMALVEAGKPAEAWPHFEHAVTQKPENTAAHLSYGQSLWRAGKRPEAAVEFRRAAEANPESADGRYALGLVAVAEDRPDEARHNLEAALQDANALSDGKFVANAFQMLGELLLKQKQPAASIRYFAEAARLEPKNIDAMNRLSAALIEAGETAKAIEEINKTLQIAPDSTEAQTLMQRAIERQMRKP